MMWKQLGLRNALAGLSAAACASAAVIGPAKADELRDYGEYLAGECSTCHRNGSTNEAIPPIFGWPKDAFIAVLLSYKKGERDNPAMVSVAKSLDDEQMKALAVYFGSIKPKN